MVENKILIKNAATIVCCNDRGDAYQNADTLTKGERVLEIGYGIQCDDAEILDGKDKSVYPGLVSTHRHFFQIFVKDLATIDYPNMLVVGWPDKIYRTFQRINSDVIYYSSLTAAADLVKHGCTMAFGHQYYFTVHTKKEAVDHQMGAASWIGIRYHTGRGTSTFPRSQGNTIPDDTREATGEFIQDTRRLIYTYHGSGPFSMKQIVIASCQPVNCYEDTFIQSVKLVKKTEARLHTHLGGGENDIMEKRWGMRTSDRCKWTGFLGENIWFARCWGLTDEEYKVPGANGCGISHCPPPAILGDLSILEMKKLMDCGALLSLGYDGSATSDSSNLLNSIHIAYMMQCYHSKERGGGVSTYEIPKQAMVNGVRTLSREDIGFPEEGKVVNLFMIGAGALELAGAAHNPRNITGRVGLTGNVYMTIVNDKVVYGNGRLVGVDERGLTREGERVCDKVLREPCEAFRNLFRSNLF